MRRLGPLPRLSLRAVAVTLFVTALCAAFGGVAARAQSAGVGTVAVVASDQKPFRLAEQAARAVLQSDGSSVDGDAVGAHRVVVSIGPVAGRTVAAALAPGAVVVACLTPSTAGFPAGRTVVVPLHPGPRELLQALAQALPAARTVGVALGPDDDPGAWQAAARALDLTVVLVRAPSGTSLLQQLQGKVDAALVHRNHPLSGDSEGLRLFLAQAVEQKLPVAASSPSAVNLGALLALVPDPAAHGHVAGEVARRLLRGERDVVATPPKARLVVSARVERALGTRVAGPARAAADVVN